MDLIARHVLITGRVQGVAFRWSTRKKAQSLGVAGWCRNLNDGRVEVLVEGPPDIVEAMLTWLAHGPPTARVTQCNVSDAVPEQAESFTVRPDGP